MIKKPYLPKLLSFMIITLFLFPIFLIGKTTSIKPDWIIVKIIILLGVLKFSDLFNYPLYRKYIIIFLFLVPLSIISNYLMGWIFLDNIKYNLPTSIISVLDRLVVFIFFSYSIINNWISFHITNRLITWVFLFALSLGVFQFIDLFGARDFALNYYLAAGGVQEYNFLMFNRIIGVAPAIITWGGVSVMIFHYFYFLVNNKYLKIIGLLFAIFNIMASASRAAIVAFIISLIVISFIKSFSEKNKFISLIKTLFIIIGALVILYIVISAYLPEQVDFLLKRFSKTEEALTTSGRGSQLNNLFNYIKEQGMGIGFILGIGPSAIKNLQDMEIDYAQIFFSFGIIGFVLHYLLIYYLLREVYKYKKYNQNLYLFTIASTVGYLVFSVGFYFFYELYMGMPFWWLNGIVVGQLWYLKDREIWIK